MDDDNSEDKWIAPDSTNETYPVTVPYTSASVSLYHSTFNGVSHFRSQDRYACLDEIQAFGEQFIHVCNINCKHFNVSYIVKGKHFLQNFQMQFFTWQFPLLFV